MPTNSFAGLCCSQIIEEGAPTQKTALLAEATRKQELEAEHQKQVAEAARKQELEAEHQRQVAEERGIEEQENRSAPTQSTYRQSSVRGIEFSERKTIDELLFNKIRVQDYIKVFENLSRFISTALSTAADKKKEPLVNEINKFFINNFVTKGPNSFIEALYTTTHISSKDFMVVVKIEDKKLVEFNEVLHRFKNNLLKTYSNDDINCFIRIDKVKDYFQVRGGKLEGKKYLTTPSVHN